MGLIYPTYRFTIPSLVVVLLLVAVVSSFFNDNHQVRILKDAPKVRLAERLDLRAHFKAWDKLRSANQSGPDPVFVVAAEGGGIRAAYWTASVLAQLEDDIPGFACHVFAISGVSGGSLGGAVFAALVADLVDAKKLQCSSQESPTAGDSSSEQRESEIVRAVEGILGKDFLAPTLAGMFFPDLMQRFNIFSGLFRFPDRASYLEASWESAWKKSRPSDRFAQNFFDLWNEPRQFQVPSLFLNGTWVESGGRNVTSNIRVDGWSDQHGVNPFVQIDDMFGCMRQSIRLSTAVHMSARFTYVSPAGTIEIAPGSDCRVAVNGKEKVQGHVVDGGYFENSGALTAAEIVAAMALGGQSRRPIVLVISNNPNNPNGAEEGEESGSDADSWGFGLGDALSPILALLNTRSARGFHAEDALAHSDDRVRIFRSQLRKTDPKKASLPLGWMLSPDTRKEIRRQAATWEGIAKICKLVRSNDLEFCQRLALKIQQRS